MMVVEAGEVAMTIVEEIGGNGRTADGVALWVVCLLKFGLHKVGLLNISVAEPHGTTTSKRIRGSKRLPRTTRIRRHFSTGFTA